MRELDSLPAPRSKLSEILQGTYEEGCVAEGKAAAQARERHIAVRKWLQKEPACGGGLTAGGDGRAFAFPWQCEASEQIVKVLQMIATEEEGHAELAWRTMEWGVGQYTPAEVEGELGGALVEAVVEWAKKNQVQ
jgi:hypothetical protein